MRIFGKRAQWRITLAAVVVSVAVLQGGVTATAQADPTPAAPPQPYQVPHQFLHNFLSNVLHIGTETGAASPAGTNNWKCTPSPEHPEPVILVHGYEANRNNTWPSYGPELANRGYCVFALNYGSLDGDPNGRVGGLTSMENSAKTLDAFVDRVRQATGAPKVALVGHSEGATMPYWYLKFGGGAGKVSKMIGLAPAVHGIGSQAFLDLMRQAAVTPPAAWELLVHSAFMKELSDGGITVPGVAYTQIVTRGDGLVVPYTSGVIDEPGSTNYVLQDVCPQDFADHMSILGDPNAGRIVLNALDPEHSEPVECTLVLPIIGAIPGIPMG